MVKKVLIFRPTLDEGGADRVTITLLHHLDRSQFAPTLVLVRKSGVLLREVPADVEVIGLGARRLAMSAPALARTIRKLQPDIIFSTCSGSNSVAVLARFLARSQARLVLSERNALVRDTFSRSRVALEIPLKRFAYRHADLVTAVSDGVAQDLVDRLGLPRSQVFTVWNPVITADFEAKAAAPVEHPWFDGTQPVLLACGRMVPQKDYATMFDAFVQIRAQHPVRLAVLGDGALREALQARVTQLGLADHVAFLGFDPNPMKYMAKAYALVQSSRAEGLPGTLIQSMAVGTPVVATDCDFGPREVVSSGVDGWLVPVGDAGALAARVGELLADPAQRARFSARA
nr:glycosyltransferase [Myxococcota bacterium]